MWSPWARLLPGLVLAVAVRAGAADGPGATPLPWQDPGAVDRMVLRLPFEAPDVLAPGQVEARVPVFYANHLVLGTAPDLAVEIDFEGAAAFPGVRVGIAPGLELQAALPVYWLYGGILDGTIDHVERFLHATNLERIGRPYRLTRLRLVRPDGSGISIDAPTAGVGDFWAGFKASLLDGGDGAPALAIRGAVKLPTGGTGFGSGNVDLGFGGILAWNLAPLDVCLEADLFAPTGSLQGVGLAGRVYGTGQLGLAWSVSRVVAVHAQVSAHLAPFWSDVDGINLWTFYVLLGAALTF